jgi:glycosyltransferase involved in cell wall biosynthesis
METLNSNYVEPPQLTVVMPVRNEAGFIQGTLETLLNQDYPTDRYKIIVADGMSDDGTRDIVTAFAEQHPQVSLIDNPKRLSSAGRNVGFRNGSGDYFIVIDGHCYIPDNQLLRNVADCFIKSGADCLGRPQPLDPPGLSTFQQAIALARKSPLGHGGDSLIYSDYEGYASPVSNGAAYSRNVFQKVGFVDEEFDACEDVEFNYRVMKAGLKAFMSPKLRVHYFPRENLGRLFRQMVRYGRGRYRLVKKYRDAFSLNQLIPAVFVVALFLVFFLGIWSMFFDGGSSLNPLPAFEFLGAIYILYLFLLCFESTRIAVRNGWKFFPYQPVIFFMVHFGLGYGFLAEFFKGCFLRLPQLKSIKVLQEK